MEIFNAQFFVLTLALVGVVIIIAALLSGLIDQSDLPQVGIFLALGAMLGPAGLGLLEVTLESPNLRVVATLSLVLVLFTDAVSLSIAEVRRHSGLAFRVLGPGTLLSAGLIAFAGWLLLDLPLAAAAILGAALASTDPVMLRGLLRRPGLSEPVRLALRLESGLNDAVLLPVVLVAMPFLGQSGLLSQTEWARIGLDLFLLGPGAGVAVGLLAIGSLEMIRRKTGVRRDYESIYSLGVAFAAYAAAEAVHGSGFLAAFAAGLTVAALDVELCDCFLEYGQTTAEMALLFTFVLFGSSLIWSGFLVLSWPMVFFAAAVLLIRPIAFFVSLAGTRLDCRSRLLIAWFGPRGLSSLLLILVPVFALVPGAENLFSICCLIVLLSVALHGGSLMCLKRDGATAPAQPLKVAIVGDGITNESPATLSASQDANHEGTVVTIAEMRQIQLTGAPYLVLDVRAEVSFASSDLRAQGSLRISPDRAVSSLTELDVPRQTWLFAFCA
ncbi:MAG TPA: cation:proton antiporter [Candidatus Binatia bacterium]|nr:cation:proton antiporter [Candidatus Binatia bacterium]